MDCGLRTTDCGLGIKYGLGIKCGLRTEYIYYILLLLIARKLTFEYDQMRVTSKIPKNYKQKH